MWWQEKSIRSYGICYNPRVKNQNYCNRKACQRVRKNKWKQSKIASDPDYKNDQRDCHKQWIEQHPGYYQNYRKQNPDYCDRNRELQKKRDKKRRSKRSCKRDALKHFSDIKPGTYKLIPFNRKRDTLELTFNTPNYIYSLVFKL